MNMKTFYYTDVRHTQNQMCDNFGCIKNQKKRYKNNKKIGTEKKEEKEEK